MSEISGPEHEPVDGRNAVGAPAAGCGRALQEPEDGEMLRRRRSIVGVFDAGEAVGDEVDDGVAGAAEGVEIEPVSPVPALRRRCPAAAAG